MKSGNVSATVRRVLFGTVFSTEVVARCLRFLTLFLCVAVVLCRSSELSVL